MNSLMKREAQREKGVRSRKRWWEEEGLLLKAVWLSLRQEREERFLAIRVFCLSLFED
jgi:hypothetical protein